MNQEKIIFKLLNNDEFLTTLKSLVQHNKMLSEDIDMFFQEYVETGKAKKQKKKLILVKKF